MSIDRRLVRQTWGGDSHTMDHHLVPHFYRQIVEAKGDEAIRYRQPPITGEWQRGGLHLTVPWIDSFNNMIRKHAGIPSCYVLCAGTNNLRASPTQIEKRFIVDMHREVIDQVLRTEAAALCIVSPIPDGKGKTDAIGEELDQDLRELCDEKKEPLGRIQYIRFRTRKLPHGGRPSRFSQQYFKPDKVHLNPTGARMLAESIYNAQTMITNMAYNMSKDEVSIIKRIQVSFPGWTIRQFDEEMDRLLQHHRNQSVVSDRNNN